MNRGQRAFSTLLLILVIALAVSSCSVNKSSTSKTNKKSDTKSQSSKTTTTSDLSVTNLDTSKSFQAQVQDVCNSIDPQVFNDIIHVDISKDIGFEDKFNIAVASINKLKNDFSSITPPTTSANDWALGIDNLDELQVLVSRVSDQYSEYLALIKESQTTTDINRLSEILNRTIQLVSEYISTLQSIQTRFTEVLRIGVVAGIYECKAFQIS